MRWWGRSRETASDSGALNREAFVAALREGSREAETTGRLGGAAAAADRYETLVAQAERVLGDRDTDTLAMRHQLAHWTGESGRPEAAVRLFARLSADRERVQGPRHRDTELARHQLAHWHGRAGRPEEAVRRYESMRRTAEREHRTETALTLLCEVGYWHQKSGDNAAALRAFSQMLRTAQQELGPRHQLVRIARQRYAEVAGELPFGNEGGHEGLRDLLATAAAVEAAGDLARAGRMYGEAARRYEQLDGPAGPHTLSARVAQAKAMVGAGDHEAAVHCFGKVLACMELRGQGPGTPEYDVLSGQRDELARMARRTVLRIARGTASLLGEAVPAGTGAACAVLARRSGSSHATRVVAVDDDAGDPARHAWPAERWTAVLQDLTRQGYDATALCFPRGEAGPGPDRSALCERLGLPGVFVSLRGDGTVQAEAYVFHAGEPAAAHVVVVEDGQPAVAVKNEQPAVAVQDEQPPGRDTRRGTATGSTDDRVAVHPGAVALGGWRKMERARPAAGADRPPAFGAYEVLEPVGEGGFGRVYLCQDPDGLMVAVKTLHAHLAAAPSVKRGFAHEVQAARRVDGRFTVPVIDSDTDGPTPWMAVPYVAAPSLQTLAEHCGPLDPELVRTLGAGIAVALSAIHAEGIVHLDLKPANVLLTEDGPRVIDFGIAQIEQLTEPRRGFTGTYAYASPEQLREQPAFTPASDVFSLGTVLARLVLGRSPWGRDTPSVVAGIRGGLPDLTGLPADFAAVVRSCLRPDPRQRPTAAAVAEALVPGAGAGAIGRPHLTERARSLVAEHTTLPATRHFRTPAPTRTPGPEETARATTRPLRPAEAAATTAEATRAATTAVTTAEATTVTTPAESTTAVATPAPDTPHAGRDAAPHGDTRRGGP